MRPVSGARSSDETPLDLPNAPSYAGLTPDTVLDALDSVGLRGDGRLLALNSYENRVYQASIEEVSPVVAKFYRPARWSAAAILEDPRTLEWLGCFLGRIHAVGVLRPYRDRPTVDLASFGEEPRDFLLSHGFLP